MFQSNNYWDTKQNHLYKYKFFPIYSVKKSVFQMNDDGTNGASKIGKYVWTIMLMITQWSNSQSKTWINNEEDKHLQWIQGLIFGGSSARLGFTNTRISSQASHDAYTLREDKPSVDAHAEVEENWGHVPYPIKEAIISEYFLTFSKLQKKT